MQGRKVTNDVTAKDAQTSNYQKTLLLVGGCPRSGTSALVQALNMHPEVLVGHERFFHLWRKGTLTAGHFEKSRFLNVEDGDTFYDVERIITTDFSTRRYPAARLIGDKYPRIYECYGLISEQFPDAHILYIVRNPFSVAESYQARYEKEEGWTQDFREAIREWNRSLAQTIAFLRTNSNMTVVSYETLFSSIELLDGMFRALGLDPANSNRAGLQKTIDEFKVLKDKPVLRREDIRYWVSCSADFISYRTILQHAIDQKSS